MNINYILYCIVGLILTFFVLNYKDIYQHNHSSIISNYFPDSDIGKKFMEENYPLFMLSNYEKYVLYPGDILHIPKNYAHWCFSIGDPDNYNLNISINYWDEDKNNNFGNRTNLLRIEKKYLEVWNKIIVDNLINDNISNYPVILSKNKEITPVDKGDNSQTLEYMTMPEIFKYRENSNYNIENEKRKLKIALAQNQDIIKKLNGFNPNIYPISHKEIFNNINFWMNFGDINTGLHFDEYVGFLVQMIGIKIVYLFEPKEKDRLYFNKNFKSL